MIAGHGRLLACRHLGWTEVPTIRIDHLGEAQKRAFMIADNQLTEIAVWDDRLLAEQLMELSSLDLEFDFETTGFDIGEIDLRIESLSEADEPVEPPLPAVTGPAVTQRGDLWRLSGLFRFGQSTGPASRLGQGAPRPRDSIGQRWDRGPSLVRRCCFAAVSRDVHSLIFSGGFFPCWSRHCRTIASVFST